MNEKLITTVKNKLWKFGYSVKDYTKIPMADFSFHLLVEGDVRVRVGDKRPKALTDDYDVFAEVDGDQVTFIKKPTGAPIISKSPYDIFGRKN